MKEIINLLSDETTFEYVLLCIAVAIVAELTRDIINFVRRHYENKN